MHRDNALRLSYIIVLCLILPLSSFADESIGQVVFYSYQTDGGKQDRIEAESDFSHHVGGILKHLEAKHIKHEIIRKAEFTIDTLEGQKLRIDKTRIPIATGYIMIKKNGEHEIRNGMGTDADMLMDIYAYFGIEF